MREIVRPLAATLTIACLAAAVALMPGAAWAQAKQPPAQAAPGQPPALKQMPLTDKQIEGVLAAQHDMDAITEKLPDNVKPDPQVIAQLDAVAKKHGFASFSEYDDVAANISMVMAGIDPQSRAFTEPKVAIQKEIDEVKGDTSIPEKEKKQMLDELAEALKSAQPIQHPANVELVKKYWEKIDAVLQ